MKKISILTIIGLALTYTAQAQITLTGDDALKFGTYNMATDTTHGFDPGTAGGNKTWDFSKLVKHETYTDVIAPFSGSGIDANIILISDGDTSTYFKKTTADLSIFFEDFTTGMGGKLIRIFKLPVTFNKTDSDSAKMISTFPGSEMGLPIDSIRATTNISISSKADAWGSLKLASGTYNTLRVKSDIRFRVTLEGKTGKLPYFPIPGFDIDEMNTTYTWYNNGNGYQLLIYDEQSDIMDFQVSTGANVKNVPVKNTSIVVTNPMNNQFTAKNTGNNNVVINMVDQNGRVIFTQNLDAHSSLEKDMSAVANGVYTMQIQDLSNNSISYQKLIK
jgi:hypothetical protein